MCRPTWRRSFYAALSRIRRNGTHSWESWRGSCGQHCTSEAVWSAEHRSACSCAFQASNTPGSLPGLTAKFVYPFPSATPVEKALLITRVVHSLAASDPYHVSPVQLAPARTIVFVCGCCGCAIKRTVLSPQKKREGLVTSEASL